jgi:transcriptional regulator with PAS, ATPase and Fis domain
VGRNPLSRLEYRLPAPDSGSAPGRSETLRPGSLEYGRAIVERPGAALASALTEPDSLTRSSVQPGTEPTLAILLRSDAFAQIWEGVAADAGAVLRAGATASELAPLHDAIGVLVSLAGREEDAQEAIDEIRSAGGGPVAVVGSTTDHRVAVTVMAAGAANYFALPGELEALREWVRERAGRAATAEQAAKRLDYERTRYDFSRIVGESPGVHRALERAARVIPRDTVTVLITGETGTGKELLAQAIHYNGPRGREPFVEVNCAALPENLLEAELFGYEKGAFTDARAAKPGLFEAAHRGALFLDEIGELTLALQAKLLKVLEDKQVRRLGSVRSVVVDVRIIAATHANLVEMIREGRFRRDLYYRLNVLQAELPPLRERGNDILVLTEHFLERFSRDYDVPRATLTPEVRRALLSYPWPGNIRELRNAVERAVLMGDGTLALEDLFEEREAAPPQGSASGAIPFPSTMDEIEQAAARAMVARFAGNKTAAAEALRISRTRLYRLLGEEEGA